jgi:hypothetical protein
MDADRGQEGKHAGTLGFARGFRAIRARVLLPKWHKGPKLHCFCRGDFSAQYARARRVKKVEKNGRPYM